MGLNTSNKINFYFVCTNYASSRDGIGHYTSKIVNELKKNSSLQVSVYSKNTYHLSKIKLFFSLKMTKEIIKLTRVIDKKSGNNYIVLEYPFVEYNPSVLLALLILKKKKKDTDKIVISLHEYSRTKKIRKLFIKALLPVSDIVLYTKDDDIKPFIKQNITFKKRIIPANIQPKKEIKTTFAINNILNIGFFGIINFKTKEIYNMIKSWEVYKKNTKSKTQFHFISSSYNKDLANNQFIKYYHNLSDTDVSKLLLKINFLILPLKPKISINNGSLSAGCIHKCIPVGVFDSKYFDEDFGLRMKNYSVEEFDKVYSLIHGLNFAEIEKKSNLAYEYGNKKSIVSCTRSYIDLINL